MIDEKAMIQWCSKRMEELDKDFHDNFGNVEKRIRILGQMEMIVEFERALIKY